MCKRRMIISLWILLVFVEGMAVADTAPVILARLNNIDARDIISKLSSNLYDVDKIVAERETSFDPDEVISGEKAREDVYTIGNVTLTVSEPYGDVYISWPAKTYDDYLTVEEEQTQKYDIDRDGYLDDGQTRMCEKTFVPEDDVQPEIKEACDSTARFVASLFGVEVVDHYVTSFALKSCFPDGQQYLTGTFKYGIIRNGLPVDTAGIWSEVSRAGFFVRGESITIQWIETEVLSAHVELYQIESEDFLSETFISSEMAEGKVHQEIEKLSSAFNSEPYVDLCYMAVPDRRGLLYATLVPAWRFRFTGEYLEESNCHRVNAYTGEVIR